METPDTKPGNYYVSAIKDDGTGRWIPLAGPFRDDHAKALSLVDKCNDLACKLDRSGRAHWYAYGTCRAEYDFDKPGILNDKVAM